MLRPPRSPAAVEAWPCETNAVPRIASTAGNTTVRNIRRSIRAESVYVNAFYFNAPRQLQPRRMRTVRVVSCFARFATGPIGMATREETILDYCFPFFLRLRRVTGDRTCARARPSNRSEP